MTDDREDVPDHDRRALDRLLAVPETAWLLGRVRARLVGYDGSRLTGVVRLSAPTEAQRTAAARLVGRPRRSGTALSVELGDVEEILRRGPWPTGLAHAVETLTGPVVDRAAERRRSADDWAAAEAGLGELARASPDLARWWSAWCASGGLKRAARAEAARTGLAPGPEVGAVLVAQTVSVLRALPSSGEPLAVLARRVIGDAHALDSARPLGRLAAATVEAAFAPSARSGREAWAAAGVVLSTVASTALCLGVAGAGTTAETPVGRATVAVLEAVRAARTPVVLTLDQVRSGGVAPLPPGGVVHVCENPTIIEVVAERWSRSGEVRGDPVLVCTGGQPSTAVVDLLLALTAGGAGCRYHGDFDWPGLRIAQTLQQRVGWTSWRFDASDYEAALARGLPSRPLVGHGAPSPWDPGLQEAMARHGLAVEEEAVADLLADDLVDPRAS